MLRIAGVLCVCILSVAGCGAKETGKDKLRIEPIEQADEVLDEAPEAAGDSVAEGGKGDIPDGVPTEDAEKSEEAGKAVRGEELIVSYSNACTAGMFERVYDYDPVLGELKDEFCAYPALTYYDNGFIKADWSHNQGYGELWPFTLYRYDEESDSYVEAGTVATWDKEIREQWFSGPDGQPFPDELDTDGDGTLYYICREGEECTYAYEDYKYNKTDYEAWYGEMMDEAKALLSERYGVVMERPDTDFEEWTVGLHDGKERFTFEALNAGHIGYNEEQVEDVTVFGIYPGISVDAAWEKLKDYGFYASSYSEVENCLITGEGFGNISIWFSEENGVVTTITAGPYCAFAG